MSKKQIVMTGFQSTGRLHIGNYTVIKQLQKSKDKLRVGIMNLHSMIGSDRDSDETEKDNYMIDVISKFLPSDAYIYIQSELKDELYDMYWKFMTMHSLQDLLTEAHFIDKANKFKEEGKMVTPALLTYPLLQAADILYWADEETLVKVPVGKDQMAHLELTRKIARKIGYIEPEAILVKEYLIRDLKNPELKMSKSNPNGCLFLDDSKDEMVSKIKKAVTSSNNELTDGVVNLFNILDLLEYDYSQLKQDYIEHKINNGTLKNVVTDVVINEFYK